MMQSALRKEVDVVLAESLDRFSRDQEDTASLFKRLTFNDIIKASINEIWHLVHASAARLECSQDPFQVQSLAKPPECATTGYPE